MRVAFPYMFSAAFLALVLSFVATASHAESQCFGTVSNGRIEDSVKLPPSGPSFAASSSRAVSHRS